MNTVRTVVATAFLVVIAQTTQAAPSMEELRAQYEKRILAEVELNDRSSSEDLMNAAMAIAKDVFGRHPGVLRAKGAELLEKVPSLKPAVLKGYALRLTVTNIAQSLAAEKVNEDLFLVFGWRRPVPR